MGDDQQFFVFYPVTLIFDLDIRTQARFLYNALTAKFHRLTFNRSEVIVLTNKQTDKQINRSR